MAAKPSEPADEADADAEGTPPPKKKISRKLILIAAGALVVLGGGGGAAYVMLGAPKDAKSAPAAVKPVAFIDIPDVLVNLSGTANERAQYLKVKIVLEVPDQALVAQVQTVMPRVLDAFQTYLRELRPIDLEGSAGLYRLREELTRRVNLAIEPGRINAVLFKEIIIQ